MFRRAVADVAEVGRLDAELAELRSDVDAVLENFMAARAADAPDPCLAPLIEVVRAFLRGGKRLRPLFCCSGWAAAGRDPRDEVVLGVGAALELFHSFALIHDDVMDDSDQRRGRPTVHRALGADDSRPDRFGVHVAILLGDACMVWSDELLHDSGISPLRWRTVRRWIHVMRTELIAGQYLDIAEVGAEHVLDRAWRVIRHKTAAYTVARPLQIGAALAGADEHLLAGCARYGFPLGEAFQLRDDVLGVFGDPLVTGKSALDDLRAGKPTVLIGLAWRRADSAQRAVIRRSYGDAELDDAGAARLREIIRDTRARDEVERMIAERCEQAVDELARMRIPGEVRDSLRALADTAATRNR